jgi:hypothetical protein
MANILVEIAYFISVGNATDMQPGESHPWTWGLGNINEAITFTAHPRASFNTGSIVVEDVRISEGFQGHLAELTVRNAGSTPINWYALTASFISQ